MIKSFKLLSPEYLTQKKNALWQCRAETLEQHVEAFLSVDRKIDSSQWAMAAIAASIETKYGEGQIQEFAEKVEYTPRHVRRMAQTYREAQKGRWRPHLSFKHHTEALSHSDPDAALDEAESKQLSAIALRRWIQDQRETSEEPRARFALHHLSAGYKLVAILREQIAAFPTFADELNECIDRVTERARRTRATDRERVLKALKEWENGLSREEIMEDTGLSEWDVRQILGDLIKAGRVRAERERSLATNPTRCKNLYSLIHSRSKIPNRKSLAESC